MPRTQFAPRSPAEELRRIVDQAASPEHAESGPEHESPAPAAVQRTMTVGAADDRAEHEADAIADQVLARLAVPHQHDPGCGHHDAVRRTPTTSTGTGTATIGAAGGDLDTHTTTTIENARGTGTALPAPIRREMETGFGHSLADIRIHTDNRAAHLNRTISARAFTTGRDIFFGAGEYAPHTTDGKRVLAHEIAHTRQGHGIRRKLRGTAQALESQGGGETSTGLRKLSAAFATNWDKILAGVRKYEKAEGELLNSGKNPGPATLMQAKKGLLKILTAVQGHIGEWRKANDEEGQKAKQKSRQDQDEDGRTKAGRRQAINMLAPRIGNEVTLLTSSDAAAWTNSLGISDAKMTSQGRDARGGVNQVKELNYTLEGQQGGDDIVFSGFFKADTGHHARVLDWEQKSGISASDPNYGARSVALYRLDKILGADVTARAEFAVRTDPEGKTKMGTVLESASGRDGQAITFGYGAEHTAAMGPGAVNLEDEVLQRSLNKLQILDVIAGQLDRHAGNYFIDTDAQTGAVTGVTGIDLDMAFGSEFTGITQEEGRDLEAANYRGMPEWIDKPFAVRLLQISPDTIKQALTGLLAPGEVAATLVRFSKVQDAIRTAREKDQLVDKWDGTTARRGKMAGSDIVNPQAEKRTQLDNLQFENMKHVSGKVQNSLAAALAHCKDEGLRKALSSMVRSRWTQKTPDALLAGFHDHELTPAEFDAATRMFINEVNGPAKSRLQQTAASAKDVSEALDDLCEPLMRKSVSMIVAKRGLKSNAPAKGRVGSR